MLPILSIRIKELRKEKKWSQRELGEKVDVSESFVSKVESGKKQPSREVTTKFSEVFNVTTDYLLGRSEDPELNEEEDKVVSEEGKNIMSLIESLPEDERKKAWEQLEMYVTYMQNKKNS
ncbi:DNA-binding transcriptional regulator, XRE-family HTH domain [Bacillus sp. ok061]|uniref:helix-turn-helix domain-containing protein n=1 Tax=Bacillus sp. ok061 TaxID=1761766 RepID=UPI00089E568B|nr:helix-turn-helix transcriptional regulator [Bacillus sp. ok061]SEG56334.1 DNA-binding transcriptional regulator, XRE-family HTH domain [Bacillus sp. ok061]